MKIDSIKNVVVVGAGTMGPGMAATFARHGYDTTLTDIDADQIKRAADTIKFVFNTLVEGEFATTADIESARGRLTLTASPSVAVAEADFIVETVPERLETKRQVLEQMAAQARADAILASDTSGIPISMLQKGLHNPGRVIGMHWSNPPHLIPIIEVVKGDQTDSSTVDLTVAVVESLDMVPGIVDRDVPGFVENRILYAIMREALHLLDEGVATPEAIDKIVKWGIGYKLAVIGPLELLDVAGLDIYTAVAGYLNKNLSSSGGISKTVTDKVGQGKLGIKTKGGLFEYTPEQIQELARNRARLLVASRKVLMSR